MTDEEYLRASGGWCCAIGATHRTLMRDVADPWSHDRFGFGLTLAEAVAMQLAEDRARYNFVRERSAMVGGLLKECDVSLRCEACGDETEATPDCWSPKCSRCGGHRKPTTPTPS